MWTSTVDLDPKRVVLTQFLRYFWPGACYAPFAPLSVCNVPRQTLPATNWVRVRNRLAGICGSDLHLICADGDFRIALAALPRHRHAYLGHEVVGEVIEIGEDVQRLRVGDRVALQFGSNCISAQVNPPCHACAVGNYQLCEQGKLPGPQPIGGGWSEEMLLHESQLFPVSSELSDEQAVMLEPSAVALHAVLRHLPQAGERVLIVGAGTIGLLTLQVLRALVPQAEVSVLARHTFQVEQATRMGAAHIIYPRDSYRNVQRVTNAQLYQGAFGNKMLLGGYDVIYDTIGSRKTLHDALRWARTQATVVLIGLSLHQMHIDLTPIWCREINLLGSFAHGIETGRAGTKESRSTFRIAEKLIARDQLHPEQLITHHFAVNNYREAVMAAMNKSQSHAVKIVFDYSLLPASVVPNVRASARKQRKTPLMDSAQVREDAHDHVDEDILSEVSVAPSAALGEEHGNDDTLFSLPAIKKPMAPATPVMREEEDLYVAEVPTVKFLLPKKTPFVDTHASDEVHTPEAPVGDVYASDAANGSESMLEPQVKIDAWQSAHPAISERENSGNDETVAAQAISQPRMPESQVNEPGSDTLEPIDELEEDTEPAVKRVEPELEPIEETGEDTEPVVEKVDPDTVTQPEEVVAVAAKETGEPVAESQATEEPEHAVSEEDASSPDLVESSSEALETTDPGPVLSAPQAYETRTATKEDPDSLLQIEEPFTVMGKEQTRSRTRKRRTTGGGRQK